MIDPESHLLLHRLQHHDERGRHHSHMTATRATRSTGNVVPAPTAAAPSPWKRLARAGRRRFARGPTPSGSPSGATAAQAIPTAPLHTASSARSVTGEPHHRRRRVRSRARVGHSRVRRQIMRYSS